MRPPLTVRRVPRRADQVLGRVRRIYHWDHDTVYADVENALDSHRIVPRRPNDHREVTGGGCRRPGELRDGFEAYLAVFGIDEHEIESGPRCGFHDGRMTDGYPRPEGIAVCEPGPEVAVA